MKKEKEQMMRSKRKETKNHPCSFWSPYRNNYDQCFSSIGFRFLQLLKKIYPLVKTCL